MASLSTYNNKINNLNGLISKIDSLTTQLEEISNNMYPAAQYMDGLILNGQNYDKGALNQAYDEYSKVYNSLKSIKQYSQKEIERLRGLIAAEKKRIQEEQRKAVMDSDTKPSGKQVARLVD